MAKVKTLTPTEFSKLLPKLKARLLKDLKQEQEDCALPDLAKDSLWDTPEVDSKTVAKLSPAVKELTGGSLDPRWIKRGGYQSEEEAVEHIISQIKKHRVAIPAAPVPTPTKQETPAIH